MTESEIEAELYRLFADLDPDDQQRVLDFADTLVARRGVPGPKLRELAGCLPEEDARQMEKAIEEGCERVDPERVI